MKYLKYAISAAFLLASVDGVAWAAGSSHGGSHGSSHGGSGHGRSGAGHAAGSGHSGLHSGSNGHGHITAVHHGGHGHGHGHGHIGVFIGPAFGYYAPYYYPYPPVIVAPSPPPVYIERSNPQPAAQTYYWYYCSNPEGYYPYVQECPGGWQKVTPQPAS